MIELNVGYSIIKALFREPMKKNFMASSRILVNSIFRWVVGRKIIIIIEEQFRKISIFSQYFENQKGYYK